MTQHEVEVRSRGPWDPDPQRQQDVSAACSCGQWTHIYALEDRAREGALDAWPLVKALLRDDHAQHAWGRRELGARARGKDDGLY